MLIRDNNICVIISKSRFRYLWKVNIDWNRWKSNNILKSCVKIEEDFVYMTIKRFSILIDLSKTTVNFFLLLSSSTLFCRCRFVCSIGESRQNIYNNQICLILSDKIVFDLFHEKTTVCAHVIIYLFSNNLYSSHNIEQKRKRIKEVCLLTDQKRKRRLYKKLWSYERNLQSCILVP